MSSNLPSAAPEGGAVPPVWPGEAPGVPLYAEGDPHPGRPTQSMARYVAAVWRHKWVVLLITLLGTAGGVLVAKSVRPEYEAQATVWVEVSQPSASDQGPIRTEELLQSVAWIELLKSYSVLDHVITERRLFVEPSSSSDAGAFASFRLKSEFRPGKYELRVGENGRDYMLSAESFGEVERGRVGEAIGATVGFEWLPAPEYLRPDRAIAFSVVNPRDVAVELRENLLTRMAEQNGNFLGLSLTGTDPERLAMTLNAVMERYVELAAQLKRAKLDELTSVLEEQRRYAEQNLRDAEIALESFRVQTITLPADRVAPVAAGLEVTRDPVFNSFFEMRIEREQLRQDRETMERLLAESHETPQALEALATIPAVGTTTQLSRLLEEHATKRAQLRGLRERYTNDHPQVRRMAEEIGMLERQTIPTAARTITGQIAAREAELDQQIAGASSELRQIPPRAIEEARLRRQVAIAEDLHTTLRQRYEEARLAAASSIPDIRILDRAVTPHRPVEDRRPLFILLGFAGSLGLAVAGMILLDRFDPRVRYPDQIAGELGLPILGLLPNIADPTKGEALRQRASESFREIRLGLTHAHGAAGPLLLTISSPESGDGKSFVTSNLALAFADQGHKTVVIDGDVRRGRLHHVFNAQRSPGLTDYLTGAATADEILQPTQNANVFFVGSGTRMTKGPELLSSQQMAQLVLGLRSRFSTVLVDTAPLGAGVDAYALSTITHNLLLVLRIGQTNRSFTEARLELLDRLPIRLLGAVVNGIPESRIYRYYQYLPGYEVATGTLEDDSEQPAAVG